MNKLVDLNEKRNGDLELGTEREAETMSTTGEERSEVDQDLQDLKQRAGLFVCLSEETEGESGDSVVRP